MTCIEDASKINMKSDSPKKDRDSSIDKGRPRSSSTTGRQNIYRNAALDSSSLSLIRQTIFKKALNSGLILFLIINDFSLLDKISQEDLKVIKS
jgi:hypothetical protein